MKTLKYQGKEYEVVDIHFYGGGSISSLGIIAVIKDGGLMDIIEFDATYYEKLEDVTVSYSQRHMTKYAAKILAEC